jgi:hypothetical protein
MLRRGDTYDPRGLTQVREHRRRFAGAPGGAGNGGRVPSPTPKKNGGGFCSVLPLASSMGG